VSHDPNVVFPPALPAVLAVDCAAPAAPIVTVSVAPSEAVAIHLLLYPHLQEEFPDAVIIPKPAALADVVEAVGVFLHTPHMRRPYGEADHARR